MYVEKKFSELFDVMRSMLHAQIISYLAHSEEDNPMSPGAQVTLKLIVFHPGCSKVDTLRFYLVCINSVLCNECFY